MRVETKAYGPLELDERQKIFFPYGILGFEHLKYFALLDARQHPFYWLQSMESVDVAFVLINPRVFRPDYELEVDADELEEIGITDLKNALDFVIVTIPEEPSEMTANLQGPLIINKQTRVGRQCIGVNPRWMVRHSIMKELAAVEQKTC